MLIEGCEMRIMRDQRPDLETRAGGMCNIILEMKEEHDREKEGNADGRPYAEGNKRTAGEMTDRRPCKRAD